MSTLIKPLFCLAALIYGGSMAAFSQTAPYPSKPIRFVVGFPAGSSIDAVLRIVLDDIRERTSSTLIIDNRPGALGSIGVEAVAKSSPDGYTMTASSSATHSSGPFLLKNINYDAIKDFSHVVRMVHFDVILVTNPSQGLGSVKRLIEQAKAKPANLFYGYGSGTGQVVAAAFARSADIDVKGVPYKGQPLAITDLMGGQINFVTSDLGAVLSQIKAGKLIAIGTASEKRSSIMPSVPTFSELGLKDLELPGWIGIAGPANLPSNVTMWWDLQINASLAKEAVIGKLNTIGMESDPLSGESFQKFVNSQLDKWGKQITSAGIKAE